eukprot:1156706-Pelagomonas_calceolata.AAC.1
MHMRVDARRCIWNGDAMGAAALGVNLTLVPSWTLVRAFIQVGARSPCVLTCWDACPIPQCHPR